MTGESCEVPCSPNCAGTCEQTTGTCLPRVVLDVADPGLLATLQRSISGNRVHTEVVVGRGSVPVGAELLSEGSLAGKTTQSMGQSLGLMVTGGPYGARVAFRAPACKPQWTGAKCEVPCHQSCSRCEQFRAEAGGSHRQPPGNSAEDCLACRDEEPAEVAPVGGPGMCSCIDGAIKGGDNRCYCVESRDERRVAWFDKGPPKKCRYPCKPGTTEALGEDKTTVCLVKSVVRAIFIHEQGLVRGSCPEGNLEVTPESGPSHCVREDYVRSIVADNSR